MFQFILIAVLFVVTTSTAPTMWDNLKIVERIDWGAKPPKLVEEIENPVPFVIIHHSYEPSACNSSRECIAAMQWMQKFHQVTRGWNDIGYNFAVGGDGLAYRGRGWSTIGAHTIGYNDKSIGICVIGDWRYELPPKKQLQTVQALIDLGVQLGYIQEKYHLIGHRQGSKKTECPGNRLYKEIQTWNNYCSSPEECTENIIPTKCGAGINFKYQVLNYFTLILLILYQLF